MTDVKIKVFDNGSLEVNGEVKLLDGKGKIIKTKDKFYLCRCGLSENKPFCDGSHKGNFKSEIRSEDV